MSKLTCTCDLQGVQAVLELAHHSCGQWVGAIDLLEQQISGLAAALEVLRVTALNQKQKGEATKPVLMVLERTIADLQAQLAGEQKSHQLTQVGTVASVLVTAAPASDMPPCLLSECHSQKCSTQNAWRQMRQQA